MARAAFIQNQLAMTRGNLFHKVRPLYLHTAWSHDLQPIRSLHTW